MCDGCHSGSLLGLIDLWKVFFLYFFFAYFFVHVLISLHGVIFIYIVFALVCFAIKCALFTMDIAFHRLIALVSH